MAEVSFHYMPSDHWIHRLDSRIKLLSVFLVSIVTVSSDFPGLSVMTVFVSMNLIFIGIRITNLVRELRVFLIFAVLIIAVSAFELSGEGLTQFSLSGLQTGIQAAWRFILLILVGVGFIASTSVSQIQRGAESLLRSIPFINARRIAFMVSSTLSMLPLISDAAEESRIAQQARCIHNRRNPVFRIAKLVVPLLLRVFRMTDERAQAMQARGLDLASAPSNLRMPLKGRDFLALTVTALVCFVSLAAGVVL